MVDGEYRRLTCTVDSCTGEHKAHGYCLRHYRQWQRGGVRQDATCCVHCGISINPSTVGAMYCSKACRLRAWKQANPERWRELDQRSSERQKQKPKTAPAVTAIWCGYCERCGCAFMARTWRKLCSAACHAPARTYRRDTRPKACLTCNRTFHPGSTGGKRCDYCSEACRTVAERRSKGIYKMRRRARARAAHVESVDPFKVFARDRWRCQLCGIKTPQAKRGTHHPDAPELDHIVPLAIGGEHSYRNAQCTCRRCNQAKGATVKGQLLLIG